MNFVKVYVKDTATSPLRTSSRADPKAAEAASERECKEPERGTNVSNTSQSHDRVIKAG